MYFFSWRCAIALHHSLLLWRLGLVLLGCLLLGRQLRWLWLDGRPLTGMLHAWNEV